MDELENDILEIVDEEGKKINVSLVDVFVFEDKEYAALMCVDENGEPIENENGEQELIIRYFVEEDDGCSFNEIVDDDEFDRVVEFFENEFDDDEDFDEE